MIQKLLFSILSATTPVISFSQAPSIEWEKSFGGSGSDGGFSIAQTSDLGFIISGNSDSNDGDVSGNHGSSDYWIVKLDTNNSIMWQKSLGGSGFEYCSWIEQTVDGGYIVCGGSNSNDGDVLGNHGQDDYWIVKLASTGAIQWQKCLGGTQGDKARCIRQTTDGGYIIAGSTSSNNIDVSGNHGNIDFWIVKLYAGGTIQWQKCLGGSNDDVAFAIQQTSDGGYVVAGFSNSNDGDVTNNHGNLDYWVVKLDSSGSIQWQKSLGGSAADFLFFVMQTLDGGYILGGDTDSNDGDITENHGDADCWIVKLDSSGTIQWQKSYGGTAYDYVGTICQSSDSSYIICGVTASNDVDVSGNHGSSDYWVFKINGQGIVQWQKCLGGTSNDSGSDVVQTNDGGYIITGVANSTDGDVTNSHSNGDYWIVKLAADSIIGIHDLVSKKNIFVYPNPSDGIFNVDFSFTKKANSQIEVYNSLGRLQKVYDVKNYIEKVDLSSFISGIYILRIIDENSSASVKLIKK